MKMSTARKLVPNRDKQSLTEKIIEQNKEKSEYFNKKFDEIIEENSVARRQFEMTCLDEFVEGQINNLKNGKVSKEESIKRLREIGL